MGFKEIFYNNLKESIPFAYNRFGDGELKAIRENLNGREFNYSEKRGGARVNRSLADALFDALKYEQKDYWKGIMCEVQGENEYKGSWDWVKKEIDFNYPYITGSWVFHNNYQKELWNDFGGLVKGKRVIWISGNDTDLKAFKYFGIDVSLHIKAMNDFTSDSYLDLNYIDKLFIEGDIICLNCGPIERVLVKEWFNRRPKCTFLGMGSIFDPITRGIWYKHHLNSEKCDCKLCN